MANNANLGFEHRFAFGASPHTFSGSSTRFDIPDGFTLKEQGEVLDGSGRMGSRTRREDRTRKGLRRISGTIPLNLSPRQLDFFLPFILGAAESTDTFNVADSLTGFDCLHDPFNSGSEAIKYSEVYVNTFRLRFAPGILVASLDCVGKDATYDQTFTAAALGSTATVDAPFVFHDTASGFNIQSGAIEIEEGELIVQNELEVRFRNNRIATSIRATDRMVGLVTNIPLTTTTWNTYFGDKTAVDATVVLDNGTVAATWTLYNLKNPDEGLEVAGKGEVPLILRSAARGDASDPDIRCTVVGGSL